jgi:aspartate/methionine/tyrosine aminotransferase
LWDTKAALVPVVPWSITRIRPSPRLIILNPVAAYGNSLIRGTRRVLMEIGHFKWLRSHTARYNLSSSGVMPITLGELVKLGQPGNIIDELTSTYTIDKVNIALTHGTQEGNFAALSALRELGIDRVVTVVPEYEPIRALPRFLGLRHIEVEVHETLLEVINHIEPGTVLLLSNPNNPTGLFLDRKLLWELSDSLRRRNAYAVLDSIFLEFVEEDLRQLPLENVVYTFSTSKFYTMSELKVGWVIGDEAIIKGINGIIDLVSPLVLELDLGYASILIRSRKWVRERNLGIIRPNVEVMRRLIDALSGGVKVYYTEYMPIFYMRVDCRGLTGTSLAEGLLARDVFVVPGHYFGRDDGIRVGLGSVKPETFEIAMKTIINVVNSECSSKHH